MAAWLRSFRANRPQFGNALSHPHAVERPGHGRIQVGTVSTRRPASQEVVSAQRRRRVLREGVCRARKREMAAAVAEASLMSDDDIRFSRPVGVALRLVTWLLPPHRKSWAEAMFDEIAYIPSRRSTLRWALGCTLLAVRERTSYELERTFMHHRVLKTLLGLGAASVILVAGLYAVQKPYQRERISITLHRILEAKQASPGSNPRPRQRNARMSPSSACAVTSGPAPAPWITSGRCR